METSDRKWDALTLHERLTAVNIDFMKHVDFALLSPTGCVGKVRVDDTFPTAATNGEDEWYNPWFLGAQNRKQTRYVRGHEIGHKQLLHCSHMYRHIIEKYPMESNQAMDYVVNLMLEDLDPNFEFIERPALVTPLVDEKYRGWSWLDVLRDLVQNPRKGNGGGGKGQPGKGSGQPGGGPSDGTMDGHIVKERSEEELHALTEKMHDAIRQGQMLRDRVRRQAGLGPGGHELPTDIVQSRTNYRDQIRMFLEQIIKGYEYSRYNPPNRRLRGLDMIFPSHYDEAMNELVIAADTSGSMYHILPNVLGEIAQICQHLNPSKVHLIWWDTSVAGVQTFNVGEYDGLGRALKPKGGGGTLPQCVTDYLQQHKEIDATGIVWITDGDFYSAPDLLPNVPQIWCVIDNKDFKVSRGQLIHINSVL